MILISNAAVSATSATSPTAIAGLNPPRQQRSERTLDRLLDAAEAMLATRSFEELSVSELVAAAGTSVGAFYGRFEDKDALFDVLHRRFLDRWRAEVAAYARVRRWERLTLERLVHDIVHFLAARFRAQRGVMRALAIHARNTPKSPRFAERMEETAIAVHDFLARAIVGNRAALATPSAVRAVAIGLGTVMTMLRDQVVIQPSSRRRAHPRGVLEHELAQMLIGYLRASHRRRAP